MGFGVSAAISQKDLAPRDKLMSSILRHGGNTMRIKGSVSVALAMAISLLLIPGIAIATGFRAKHLTQSRLTINSSGRPLVVQPHFVEVDRLAPEVKKGSEPAVRSMTSRLLKKPNFVCLILV